MGLVKTIFDYTCIYTPCKYIYYNHVSVVFLTNFTYCSIDITMEVNMFDKTSERVCNIETPH